MNCPNCQSELLPKAKFCRRCGTPVDKPDSTELMTASGLDKQGPATNRGPISVNCPECGTPHNPVERFCQKCNHDFSPRTTLIAPPPNIPQPVVTGEGMSQPTLPQTAGVYQQASTPVRKSRAPKVAGLVVLFVVGVAGSYGYFYLQGQKVQEAAKPTSNPYPNSPSESPSPQTQTSSSEVVKPPEPKTKPIENQPSKTDLTGRWTTADNDTVDLKQVGTIVTGTYTGGPVYKGMTGNLKGLFDGKNFVGTYSHHISNYRISGKLRVSMTNSGELIGTWIDSDGNSGSYRLTRTKN